MLDTRNENNSEKVNTKISVCSFLSIRTVEKAYSPIAVDAIELIIWSGEMARMKARAMYARNNSE